jgi:hypothetical protein
MVAIDSHLRIVFPCWPWLLQLPCADATLEIDSSSTSDCASTALLSLRNIGSLHIMFNSRALERSWSDLMNKDRSSRASASSADDSDWRISCSITDTEQRSDLIRDYTLYVVRVKHRRLDWTVSRRFSDFELLVKQLQQELPAWAFSQLKQLPPAKSFGQNMKKNSIAVVEMRRIELELYLADLCSRRAACKSSSFRKFLDFQSRLHEADDTKSDASVESNSGHLSAPSSLRGSTAAAKVSFPSRKTQALSSAAKSGSPLLPDARPAAEAAPDSPGTGRASATRRDAPDYGRSAAVEPAMYAVLYKRGGFRNSGFLRKSSWKNKAVAIWRGLLAYWPAAEEDKTRVEPLSAMGSPTCVVDLVGARITNFAERPNSFEIHVSDGIITFAAHGSDAFAAWLSCLVSCIVPSSETFERPCISTLLGLTAAPGSALAQPSPAPPGDNSSPALTPLGESARGAVAASQQSADSASWFCFPLSAAKEMDDVAPLLRLVAAVQAALEDASPIFCASLAEFLVEIDGEAYSVLRSTATGRSTPASSWLRLKALVAEPRQQSFQQLLSRVGYVSVSQPPQPYTLSAAACPFGAATEAAAIILCLRAYLDEQGQPILPDDREASIFHLPAPVIEFIRALLTMSFFIFPQPDAIHAGRRPSLTPAAGDDAGAKRRASLTSSIPKQSAPHPPSVALDGSTDAPCNGALLSFMPGRRGSAVMAALSGHAPPIVSFLASSMCRSTHGMFTDAACGSIRYVLQPRRGLSCIA